MYFLNITSEQIKAGLRLRVHAGYAFTRIWDHHIGKTSTVTGDNLPTLLPDAYPYLIRIMMDIHGWDAVCLRKTVWRIMRHRMVEHLLQPLGVKVGKYFSICFFPCLSDIRRFLMSRSLYYTRYSVNSQYTKRGHMRIPFPQPVAI